LFSSNLYATQNVLAIVFGLKDRANVAMYKKRAQNHIETLVDKETPRSDKKIKTIGAFFQAYPNLQVTIERQNVYLPFQLTTTPMEDEMKRLRTLVGTVEPKRLAMLMDLRKDILENSDLSIEQALQLLYVASYQELGALDIKEMAYLWGVSIEYMSRVHKSAKKTLLSLKPAMQEILYE